MYPTRQLPAASSSPIAHRQTASSANKTTRTSREIDPETDIVNPFTSALLFDPNIGEGSAGSSRDSETDSLASAGVRVPERSLLADRLYSPAAFVRGSALSKSARSCPPHTPQGVVGGF